jgi:hypothetical protein
MSSWSDMDKQVHSVALDLDTADRLLTGTVAPEDAPPGYSGVARLLNAVWSEPPAEPADEEAIVAKLAAVVRSTPSSASSQPRVRSKRGISRPRVVAVLVAAGLACFAGLASAGSLPGPVQDIVSATFDKVGISIPDAEGATNSSAPPRDHTGAPSAPRLGRTSTLAKKTTRARISKHTTRPKQRPATVSAHRSASKASVFTPPKADTSDEVVATAPAVSPPKGSAAPPESAAPKKPQATPPGRYAATGAEARKRTSSATTKPATTKPATTPPDRREARSGNASSGQQRAAPPSGGQGAGGSGSAGSGQQGGDPANGGAGTGGSASGNAGRNGRP